jgi:hypothetical protein
MSTGGGGGWDEQEAAVLLDEHNRIEDARRAAWERERGELLEALRGEPHGSAWREAKTTEEKKP